MEDLARDVLEWMCEDVDWDFEVELLGLIGLIIMGCPIGQV